MTTIQIYTYNENCVMAGRIYHGDDPEDNCDVHLWGDDTRENLIAQAIGSLAVRYDNRAGGAGDSFRWTQDRNVLAFLGGPEVIYDTSRRAWFQVAESVEE